MTTADHRTRTTPTASPTPSHRRRRAQRAGLRRVGQPGRRRRLRTSWTGDADLGMQDQHGTPTFLCPVESSLAEAAARHRSALMTVESGLGLPGSPERRDTLTLAGRLEVRDRQRCDCCAEVRDLVALDLNFVLLARYPAAAAPDGRPETQYRVPLARFCSPTQDLNRGYLQRSVEHANNCHQDELRRAVSSTADTPMKEVVGVTPHQPHGGRGGAPWVDLDRGPPVGDHLPAPRGERRRARRPAARAAARRPLLRRP